LTRHLNHPRCRNRAAPATTCGTYRISAKKSASYSAVAKMHTKREVPRHFCLRSVIFDAISIYIEHYR
jgi:hypothetical protein